MTKFVEFENDVDGNLIAVNIEEGDVVVANRTEIVQLAKAGWTTEQLTLETYQVFRTPGNVFWD